MRTDHHNLIGLTIITACTLPVTQAASLGDIRLQSYLGQPFEVVVPYHLEESEINSLLCAQVLPPEGNLASAGTIYPHFSGRGTTRLITLRSNKIIKEAPVGFTLQVGCSTQVMSRSYAITLSAAPEIVPAGVNPAHTEAPAGPQIQTIKTREIRRGNSAVKPQTGTTTFAARKNPTPQVLPPVSQPVARELSPPPATTKQPNVPPKLSTARPEEYGLRIGATLQHAKPSKKAAAESRHMLNDLQNKLRTEASELGQSLTKLERQLQYKLNLPPSAPQPTESTLNLQLADTLTLNRNHVAAPSASSASHAVWAGALGLIVGAGMLLTGLLMVWRRKELENNLAADPFSTIQQTAFAYSDFEEPRQESNTNAASVAHLFALAPRPQSLDLLYQSIETHPQDFQAWQVLFAELKALSLRHEYIRLMPYFMLQNPDAEVLRLVTTMAEELEAEQMPTSADAALDLSQASSPDQNLAPHIPGDKPLLPLRPVFSKNQQRQQA